MEKPVRVLVPKRKRQDQHVPASASVAIRQHQHVPASASVAIRQHQHVLPSAIVADLIPLTPPRRTPPRKRKKGHAQQRQSPARHPRVRLEDKEKKRNKKRRRRSPSVSFFVCKESDTDDLRARPTPPLVLGSNSRMREIAIKNPMGVGSTVGVASAMRLVDASTQTPPGKWTCCPDID